MFLNLLTGEKILKRVHQQMMGVPIVIEAGGLTHVDTDVTRISNPPMPVTLVGTLESVRVIHAYYSRRRDGLISKLGFQPTGAGWNNIFQPT